MRVAVYCPRGLSESIKPALGFPAEFHDSWSAFEEAVRSADCGVSVIEWLRESPGAPELKGLRNSHPQTGLVLVTRFDRENGGLLPDTADRFVWLAEVEEHLNPAVTEAGRGLCARLERYIRIQLPRSGAGRLGNIRDALLVLIDVDPPARTVKEWCALRAVSCSVSTLQKGFGNTFQSGITPLFILEVVRLYKALDEFPNASSWRKLALEAGPKWYEDGKLSPKTLSNTAARLLGQVRVPAGTGRHNGVSMWGPPLAERPSSIDRRSLLHALVGLLC